MRIFILTAMDEEFKHLSRTLHLDETIEPYWPPNEDVIANKISGFTNNENDIYIFNIGVGFINSSIATTTIFLAYGINSSDLVVNVGLCGSCNIKYRPRSVVFPSVIMEGGLNIPRGPYYRMNTDRFLTDTYWDKKHVGRPITLTSINQFVTSLDGLEDTDIIDMEAFAVAKVADYYHKKIICIKAISDMVATGSNYDEFLSNTESCLDRLKETMIDLILDFFPSKKLDYRDIFS